MTQGPRKPASPSGSSRGAGEKSAGPAKKKPLRDLKERLRTAQGRTLSSQKWLERQINDPFVRKAQAEGWRSRAAFKIMELDDKYKLFKPGARVLDLGAAPGGWLQVAVKRVNAEGLKPGPRGKVLGVDLQEIEPVAGAEAMQLDFLDEEAEAAIEARLDGRPDVVLSDMAASSTGHRQTDHLKIMALCEAAAFFACRILQPGGAFAAKILQGGAENDLLAQLKKRFAVVRHMKPESSRQDSAEMYVVATGFRPEAPESEEEAR